MQLTIQYGEPINKPWWMGIVCSEMHYFDLLSQGLEIKDLMIPWEIQDYINTKKTNNETRSNNNRNETTGK